MEGVIRVAGARRRKRCGVAGIEDMVQVASVKGGKCETYVMNGFWEEAKGVVLFADVEGGEGVDAKRYLWAIH